MAQERVEFFPREIGFVFRCFPFVDVGFRLGFDGMLLDGFFTLLDGGLEIGFSYAGGFLVANVEDGQKFGVVVLVSVLLCENTFLESLRAIKVGIEPCRHGMIKARPRRVLFGGTCGEGKQQDSQAGDDM